MLADRPPLMRVPFAEFIASKQLTAHKFIIFGNASMEIDAVRLDCVPKLLEFRRCDGNNCASRRGSGTDRSGFNQQKQTTKRRIGETEPIRQGRSSTGR